MTNTRTVQSQSILIITAILAVTPLTGALADPASTAPGSVPATTPAASYSFKFRLDRPTMTSAGVFDRQGRLVQALWTLKSLPAGGGSGVWDGKDQLGQAAAGGPYTYKVVANRGTYTNIGVIGNSGLPPSAAGHTPANIESVAVDGAGAIYTANGWDEAGADFKKWDAAGHSIYDAQFSIRNGQPNGAPYAITTDDQYLYCAVGGWANAPWNARQQIQRFNLSDGKAALWTGPDLKDGHIQVYEWPQKQVPAGTSEADAALMSSPLRALAISGDTILAADALGGKVLRYSRVTGAAEGSFPVPLPTAIAVDHAGNIWVGHEHHQVSAFDGTGKPIGQRLTGLGEVESLAFSPTGRLYVADSGAGQLKIYDVAGGTAKLARSIGQKAQPGDRAPDHYFRLRGAAIDHEGNIITIQVEPTGGARLARWSPEGRLLWEQYGAEFVSLGNYEAGRPDNFYSMSFHHYHLAPHAANVSTYIGDAASSGPTYRSDNHGVPRLIRMGKADFYFTPTGDGVQVYRVDGPTLRLAALVGGRDPGPDGSKTGQGLGEWTWSDTRGQPPAPAEINWFKKPGAASYSVFGMDVDDMGNIWFANTTTQSIWEIPVGRLNSAGNPTYDWAAAREVIPKDTSALQFQPNMAQHASDGSVYAFGWSRPWPSPQNNPFWMGGRTLTRFDRSGKLLWAVPLPEICVGLDTIPGGGCMMGVGREAHILHYSADGLLIGTMQPGSAMNKQSGWMDNHASVAVNRNPADKMLDVFAEDDFVDRIGWYRVDDRPIQTITGTLHPDLAAK